MSKRSAFLLHKYTAEVHKTILLCSYSRVDGAELLPIAEALKRYDWLKQKYYWRLIAPKSSKLLTLMSDNNNPVGFFLRVRKGRKIVIPFQAALYMSGALGRQELHNIVILEDDSSVTMGRCLSECRRNQRRDRP